MPQIAPLKSKILLLNDHLRFPWAIIRSQHLPISEKMLPVTAQRSILESATNRFLATLKLDVTIQVAHYSQLKFAHILHYHRPPPWAISEYKH